MTEIIPIKGRHHIDIQALRVRMDGQPLPNKKATENALLWAMDYWTKVTSGAITFELIDGGALSLDMTDLTKRHYWGTEWEALLATKQILSRPFQGYRIFIHDLKAGASQTFQTDDHPGAEIVIHGDKRAVAHEIGHALGLGHSRSLIPGIPGGQQEYGNGWSIMGSGTGVPDGAQLSALGLIKRTPVFPGSQYKVYAIGNYQQRGIHTLKAELGGVTYNADYRFKVGGDALLGTIDEVNGALIVYTSDQVGGVRTNRQTVVRRGESYPLGNVLLTVVEAHSQYCIVRAS